MTDDRKSDLRVLPFAPRPRPTPAKPVETRRPGGLRIEVTITRPTPPIDAS